MMVYAYVHRITEFGENEPSVQKSVFKRLRVEHCILIESAISFMVSHPSWNLFCGRAAWDLCEVPPH